MVSTLVLTLQKLKKTIERKIIFNIFFFLFENLIILRLQFEISFQNTN